ncbi:MAG: CAP domain-containing protein [Pseudomonadota bacterium]
MNFVSLTYPAWNGNSTPRRTQGWSVWLGTIVSLLLLVFPGPSTGAEPLDELHVLINEYRQQAGLPSLERNGELDRVAARHNSDMARDGFFAHCAPDGSCLKERLKAEGYEAQLWAENLAAGHATAAQVLQAWHESPDHRQNLRLEQATQIGLSIHPHGNSAVPSPLWTVVLGHPR